MNPRRWIRIGFVGVAFLVVFVLLLSPLTKWYVEKHSEEWTGRKITIVNLKLNPFRGSVTVNGFKVFERKSDAIFYQAEEFYINVELIKAIGGEFEITEAKLSKPGVVIVQTNNSFNYDDLISRFASDSLSAGPDTSQVKYWLRNILIRNGTVTYRNKGLGNEIKLTHLDVECPLIA